MAASFDYAELAADVLEILEEFGEAALFAPASAFDPATGGTAAPGSTYAATYVADKWAAGFGGRRTAGGDQGDASGRPVSTLSILVAASGLSYVPVADDFVYLDDAATETARYRIRNVEHVTPAGVAVLYVLEVER